VIKRYKRVYGCKLLVPEQSERERHESHARIRECQALSKEEKEQAEFRATNAGS